MTEIEVDLSGIELSVFFEVLPTVGLNILFIYFENEEISHLLNHFAIQEIKENIWKALRDQNKHA